MILNELQAYCLQLLSETDNSAKIFGVIKYAPVSFFTSDSEFFVRDDGTVLASSVTLKNDTAWHRAFQTIYSNRLTAQPARDVQGITYRTVLSGSYVPHSAGVVFNLHQLVQTPLILNIKTASAEYIVGTPQYPVRLSYSFDNLEKYSFQWTCISAKPLNGFTNASIILPPELGGGGVGEIGDISDLINAIFGVATYRNDDAAKAGGRVVGDLYILSDDNDYSFDLQRTPKRILE